MNGDLVQLSNLGTADFDSGGGVGDPSSLQTGDLRRKYNFGDRVSELAIPQDPFFRFVSKVGKKPTDDPQFKWTEKRDSWHKRYAYPTAFSNDNTTWVEDQSTNATTQYDTYETAGNTVYVKMAGDYKYQGNAQNVYGNSSNEIVIGADSDTASPEHEWNGQIANVKIYNRGLSSTEVLHNYNALKSRFE